MKLIDQALATLRMAAEADAPDDDLLRAVADRCGSIEIRGVRRLVEVHKRLQDMLDERERN